MTPTEPTQRRTIIVSSDRTDIEQLRTEMAPLGIDVIAQPTAPLPPTQKPFTIRLLSTDYNTELNRTAAQLKQFVRSLPTPAQLNEDQQLDERRIQQRTIKDRHKLLAFKKRKK